MRRVAGRPNYFIMSDAASDGYELEINITPVRNWNIRLNGAKSEAIESNIGKPWFEWGAQRLPVWESLVAKNGEVDTIVKTFKKPRLCLRLVKFQTRREQWTLLAAARCMCIPVRTKVRMRQVAAM